MRTPLVVFALLTVLAGGGACGTNAPSGDVDTSAEPDLAPIDAVEDLVAIDADTALDDASDADAVCDGLGCPCTADGECASGYCIEDVDGTVCADFCSGTCPDGYVCRLLENSGGDAVRLCVPDTDRTCTECTTDIDCGALVLGCVPLLDGSFCLPRCDGQDVCPEDTICETVAGRDGRSCVPSTGVCSDCFDPDNDGYGIGEGCLGMDCDEGEPGVFEGAPELCNNADDDCDGEVDEGFDLATDPDHCGACGSACDVANATPVCTDGECGVGACDEGWGDCNAGPDAPADGCESDLTAPESCGTCAELGGVPGTACGTCAEGTWTCQDDGTAACEGDPGAMRLNACGGCATLPEEVGAACGRCGSGLWACDGPDAVVCDGDLGTDAENVCGGCDALTGTPGDACGTCGSGELACGGRESLFCAGDDGEDAQNACGGCADLGVILGAACGTCDTGAWACDGVDGVTCQGDEGAAALNECGTCGAPTLNACGGCAVLAAAPGSPCGRCNLDAYVCDGTDAVTCDGDTPVNSCGGCASLDGRAGDPCGTCGSGELACDGVNALTCTGDLGDAARNACGGCSTLAITPGASCGRCGLDQYVCSGAESVVCDGDTAGNACGGCGGLANAPGASCGRCGLDEYVCSGTETTVCDGDTAINACGGCGTLANAPGASCGRCGLDDYVCSGREATTCDGDTSINACGGCGTLSPAVGTACGVCDGGSYTCNGREGTRCNDPSPPTESCNLIDDDCDGSIDDMGGACTRPVHRVNVTRDNVHFYTNDRDEAYSAGVVESENYFYLYRTAQTSVVPFYRCFHTSQGRHLYTTSASCDTWGSFYREGIMGYIATTQIPGSTPLYRSYFPNLNDHFYTTSQTEHTNAVAAGHQARGIAGYVFTSPR